jgi:inosine-uridine nucleoside N-ribohydrolase
MVAPLISPEKVKLEAITLNFGNTTMDYCRANVLRLFNVLHKHVEEDPNESGRAALGRLINEDAPRIIFSEGAENPLGGKQFTAAYFHGRDGVSGASTLEGNPFPVPESLPSPLEESGKPAYQVILDVLARHPTGTVRIAAVGPLTNIALAWQKDPETFLRVGGISVMGCALDLPGNTVSDYVMLSYPSDHVHLLMDTPLSTDTHCRIQYFCGSICSKGATPRCSFAFTRSEAGWQTTD